MSALLEVERLGLTLPVGTEPRTVLRDVTLQIAVGEAVGLVGESGSGKSMTARAIVRTLPPGHAVTGAVRFASRSILELDDRELRAFRAREVATVFQDPRAHVNPVRTIGDFLTESLIHTRAVPAATAYERAVGLLRETGISDPERRLRQYPHELSGGLLQRVAIAAALMTEPRLLIADEPTTALDVTTQSEVMAVLADLRASRGLAMLFITHDLDLAAAVCDRTAVMYAGMIVEVRPSARLLDDPLHPYTAALARSRPAIDGERARTVVVPGRPRPASEAPAGCPFSDRCAYRAAGCRQPPELRPLADGRVACWRAAELHGTLAARERAHHA